MRAMSRILDPFAQKIVFPAAMAMPRVSGLLIQKAAAVEPSIDAIRRAIAGGLVVLAAAMIATWLPALRASRGDPSVQRRAD